MRSSGAPVQVSFGTVCTTSVTMTVARASTNYVERFLEEIEAPPPPPPPVPRSARRAAAQWQRERKVGRQR